MEANRFQLTRILGVQNRHAVAEHVPDIDVAAVHHHLHAVWTSALVAVRQVPDPATDALRRNRASCGRARRERQARERRQTKQACQVVATSRVSHRASWRCILPAVDRALRRGGMPNRRCH